MTDIQNFENWTEISKGYWRYVVAANACYELLALDKSEDASKEPDHYALYVTGDWIDKKTKKSFFQRECLMSYKTLADCLYAAQEDYDANRDIIGNSPKFEVTVEDVATIQNFISKDEPKMEFNEMKALAKVVLETYLTVMEMKKKE